MSEYQYYEFQAIDRPLTADAREEMHRLSSRVQLTASSASFVYNYGDFRGNPKSVLAKYFDMMLYISNMGTRQLIFRFPVSALDIQTLAPYEIGDEFSGIVLDRRGDYLILDIQFNDEMGDTWGDWLEGAGLLAKMVQLRSDILQGDYRALYLGWLQFAQYQYHYEILEPDEDLTEPPVPPQLGQRTPALQAFIDFFELDNDLVNIAAQTSPNLPSTKLVEINTLLDQLSPAEMRGFLKQVLAGERHVDIALRKRLIELSPTPENLAVSMPRRTIRDMYSQREQVRQARLAEEARQAEKARLKKIEKIAPQEASLWQRIDSLIQRKQGHTYDEAVTILQDLKMVAEHYGQQVEFNNKLLMLKTKYPTLHGLHRRIKDAKLR